MAKEKVKEKIKFERPIIKSIKKTKRNRQATECNVIRRDRGCGICGSENIAEQGVEYCEKCGKEKIIFRDVNDFNGWLSKSNFCKCQKSWVVKLHKYYYKPYRTIIVLKCMDCGAVMSNFCPNCKPDRNCWYKTNKFYCRKCGFRI